MTQQDSLYRYFEDKSYIRNHQYRLNHRSFFSCYAPANAVSLPPTCVEPY